jgi:hypothetical protein
LAGISKIAASDEIVLIAYEDVTVVFGAIVLKPDRIRHTALVLRHSPRAGQGVVDRHNPVMQQFRIGRIDVEAFLDDGLVVLMKWGAAVFVGARPLQASGFDLQHVVAAVAVLVDPVADRITKKAGFDLLRPTAAVSIDTPRQSIVEQNMAAFGPAPLQRPASGHTLTLAAQTSVRTANRLPVYSKNP